MRPYCANRPGGTVLDPGTGTTRIAAHRLGTWSIGVELEERFCAAAARLRGGAS